MKRKLTFCSSLCLLCLLAAIPANGLEKKTGRQPQENTMSPQDLIALAQKALADKSVLQALFKQAYQYDTKIQEAFQGNYEVLPENIFPWQQNIAVVAVKVTRDGRPRRYCFTFTFSEKGLNIKLLYPGNSNTDPALFSDVYAPALGNALGKLNTKTAFLKDTQVVGGISPAGWTESWTWVDEKGKAFAMEITFTTGDAARGTFWNFKSR